MPITRNDSIDVLRFIAIIGIIIAHSSSNTFFIQLRSFDVVLMVFISAVCTKTFDTKRLNYLDYFLKRGIRLILPVWIFFTGYYIGVYLFYYLPPFKDIVASFTFISDRYVWIIRILIILSFLTPYIYILTHRISPRSIITGVAAGCIVCEIIFSIQNDNIVKLILSTIPYGLVYTLGMNINSFSRKQQFRLCGVSGLIFLLLGIYYTTQTGRYVATSEYKYPPQLYYISYAVCVTLLMWIYREWILKLISKIYMLEFAKFVGSHTYWLYLWHIPFVDIFKNMYSPLIRFCLILFGALMCVVIQDYIVRRYITNKRLITVFNG